MKGPSSGRWLERACHGFKLESLASTLRHGIVESGPDVPGSRYEKQAGIYCCPDKHIYRAAGYTNAVPSGDNLYWSGMWELLVDRSKLIPCKRPGQWQQPASSVRRTALWMRTVNLQDIPDGEGVQALWEPLFEVPFYRDTGPRAASSGA